MAKLVESDTGSVVSPHNAAFGKEAVLCHGKSVSQ